MNLRGFTLIELLIVVAIIGILASIAVPNFLNAMTRAKIARSQADIRNITTSLETYKLDNNAYPPIFPPVNMLQRYVPLTTPVSYMSTIPHDPFNENPLDTTRGPKDGNNPDGVYDYWTRLAARGGVRDSNYWQPISNFPLGKYEWMLIGFGPTESWIVGLLYPPGHPRQGEYIDYDQSNGLLSKGAVIRYGP